MNRNRTQVRAGGLGGHVGHGGHGGHGGNGGLTLVEVLVAMAVLGIVSAALVALQVSSLRVTRGAQEVRALAAAAEHQLAFARLLPSTTGCRDLGAWPAVAACQVVVACLDPACLGRSVSVSVESVTGRIRELRTASYLPLEQAPVMAGDGPDSAAGPTVESVSAGPGPVVESRPEAHP